MNVGCNDIKCKTLEVDGTEVVPRLHGAYVPAITSTTGTFSESQAYWSFEEAFLDVWFSTKMTIGATPSATPEIIIPYPPNIPTSLPLGPVPCGNASGTTLAGGLVNLKNMTTPAGGNTFALNFVHSGLSAPVTGTDVYLNGVIRVYASNP